MKKQSKLLIIGLVFAFVAMFSVSTASAAWMSDASINWIKTTATGNYQLEAETAGGWVKIFTIDSTDANAKAMLAVALTASSAGGTVTIEYDGSDYVQILRLNP